MNLCFCLFVCSSYQDEPIRFKSNQTGSNQVALLGHAHVLYIHPWKNIKTWKHQSTTEPERYLDPYASITPVQTPHPIPSLSLSGARPRWGSTRDNLPLLPARVSPRLDPLLRRDHPRRVEDVPFRPAAAGHERVRSPGEDLPRADAGGLDARCEEEGRVDGEVGCEVGKVVFVV